MLQAYGILCAFLLCAGSLCGNFASGYADPDTVALAAEYTSQTPQLPFTVFRDNLWYHAAAMLFGLTAFGFVLIPLCCMIRGFSAAYYISAATRLGGKSALSHVLFTHGLELILTVPFLLCISVFAMRFSQKIASDVRGKDSRIQCGFRTSGYFVLCGSFFLLSVIGLAAKLWIKSIT